jgi:hypothetical protein
VCARGAQRPKTAVSGPRRSLGCWCWRWCAPFPSPRPHSYATLVQRPRHALWPCALHTRRSSGGPRRGSAQVATLSRTRLIEEWLAAMPLRENVAPRAAQPTRGGPARGAGLAPPWPGDSPTHSAHCVRMRSDASHLRCDDLPPGLSGRCHDHPRSSSASRGCSTRPAAWPRRRPGSGARPVSYGPS